MPSKEQAHWSDTDIHILVEYLISQSSTITDGSSFKNTVWNEAAARVNALGKPLKGCDKTALSCKNKWARMKETYNIVAKIKAQSGFKWDDERGADIDETTTEVWAAFEKKHKGSAPFRNKGWMWFTKIQPLMPTAPRGANAYHALQGSQAVTESQGRENDELETQDSDHPLSGWESPSPPPEHCPTQASGDNNNGSIMPHQTQTPARGLKRNHSAISSSSGRSSVKRSRPSGVAALHDMNDRMEEFTDVFRGIFSGKGSGILSTPQRKAKAMQRAQDLETTLSDQRLVILIDLFRADITMADTYLSLERDSIRKEWVRRHVMHLGDIDEAEYDDILA